MLLVGFEIQDVLSVVVGLALVLLTVYRRELSCNHGYHPDYSDKDDALGSIEHRLCEPAGRRAFQVRESFYSTSSSSVHNDGHARSSYRIIRRCKSSSALSNMAASHHDDEHGAEEKSREDRTEELLESAGLFLSGGPLLAMAIALFDHLVLTTFIGSVSSFFHQFRPKNGPDCSSYALKEFSDSCHDSMDKERGQRHLYSVAWLAATDYFTDISSKLDRDASPTGHHQNNGDSPSRKLYLRSKSTGNLQNLSDEQSRGLFREMIALANRGGMDVTLLPSDAQIGIFSYLPPQDVLAFTCTNKAGRNLLEDGGVDDCAGGVMAAADEEDNSGDANSCRHVKDSDTAMLIWKSLFQRDYSWVLSDWEIGREAVQRSMKRYQNQGVRVHDQPWQLVQQQYGVLRHLASVILDSEFANNHHFPIKNIMGAATLSVSSTRPTTSMKEFYFTFSETWLNYTIAGCNSTEKCLIGLHGHVFDMSNFVEHHPGSTETVLLQAGRDATVFFENMGHSLAARKLALGMCVVVNGQCARWNLMVEESGPNSAIELRAGALGPLFSTCGLIKPWCRSLDIKRNVIGFLIPRKRSRPRYHGGLHRIRQRIKQEEKLQLIDAARWQSESLGMDELFGGVQVYHDPFHGWNWWYTDRDFNPVFIIPPNAE